jgi:hypothetical protein
LDDKLVGDLGDWVLFNPENDDDYEYYFLVHSKTGYEHPFRISKHIAHPLRLPWAVRVIEREIERGEIIMMAGGGDGQ